MPRPSTPSSAVYHRRESPTQGVVHAQWQEETGEIWGRAAQGSDIPKVKAYRGHLPGEINGIEFTTAAAPDEGSPPGQAYWSGPRPGVYADREWAKIEVTILLVRYR